MSEGNGLIQLSKICPDCGAVDWGTMPYCVHCTFIGTTGRIPYHVKADQQEIQLERLKGETDGSEIQDESK